MGFSHESYTVMTMGRLQKQINTDFSPNYEF